MRYNIEIAHSQGEFYTDIDALRVDDESANGLVVLMMIEETCKVKYIHLDWRVEPSPERKHPRLNYNSALTWQS